MNDAARALERERIARAHARDGEGDARSGRRAGRGQRRPEKRSSRARSSASPTGSTSRRRPRRGSCPISSTRLGDPRSLAAARAADARGRGAGRRIARGRPRGSGGAAGARSGVATTGRRPGRRAVGRHRTGRERAAAAAGGVPAGASARARGAGAAGPGTISRAARADPRRKSISSADRLQGPKRSSRIAADGNRFGRTSTWRSRSTRRRVSDRLAKTRSEDRFSAGGSQRVPRDLRTAHREVLRIAGKGEEVGRATRDVREPPSLVGAGPRARRDCGHRVARLRGRRGCPAPPARARRAALRHAAPARPLPDAADPHHAGWDARRGRAHPRRRLPQHEHRGRRRCRRRGGGASIARATW